MAEAAGMDGAQKFFSGEEKWGWLWDKEMSVRRAEKSRWEREGPCLEWGTRTSMEQVQRKMWGNQGEGGEAKIALFRLGKAGEGEEKQEKVRKKGISFYK